MKSIIRNIFTLEFSFVVFLTAAYFKEGLDFLGALPDLTFIFFVITLIGALIRIFQYPYLIRGSFLVMGLYLIFITAILISYLNSPSDIYADSKLLRTLVVTSWSIFGVLLIIRTQKSRKLFFYGFLYISVMMAIGGMYEFIIAFSTGSYSGTLTVFDMSYLAIGRTAPLGLIFLICVKYFSDEQDFRNSRYNFLILFILITVIVSGARMPLIALIAIFGLFSLTSFKFSFKQVEIKKKTFIFLCLSLFTLIIMGILGFLGKLDSALSRMTMLFSGSDASTYERLERYEVSWNMFVENIIFGYGYGSFPIVYLWEDTKDYPHNIFLEIAAESGLMALIPFIVMLIAAIYCGTYLYKKRNSQLDAYQLTTIGFFIFFLLNANSAGDLTDNRILITFIGLMIISPFLLKTGIKTKQ